MSQQDEEAADLASVQRGRFLRELRRRSGLVYTLAVDATSTLEYLKEQTEQPLGQPERFILATMIEALRVFGLGSVASIEERHRDMLQATVVPGAKGLS